MLAVEVHNLRKEFRRRKGRRRALFPALKDVSFTMKRGETVAILGQNGSGKSTLVRLLSTLLLHDGGSATIFGHDVFREPRAYGGSSTGCRSRRPFSRRCQRPRTSATRPVLRHDGEADAWEDPRILDRVGFPSDRRNESMENLSRGMQQKVALARALLTSPVLLLLDEPTTGLDPRSKQEVQTFIREIRETDEATILLCTHDLAEAEALADRFGILDRGELIALAPADELKEVYGAEPWKRRSSRLPAVRSRRR